MMKSAPLSSNFLLTYPQLTYPQGSTCRQGLQHIQGRACTHGFAMCQEFSRLLLLR